MSEERTVDRLLKAFMGESHKPAPPPPPGDIPPLNSMMKELITLDDRSFGRYAFSRDPLRGKFTPGDMDSLAEKSYACGIEAARDIIDKYGTQNPRELAHALGIRVETPEQPEDTSRVTFAQFNPPDSIYIFKDSLNKANELLSDSEVLSTMQGLDAEGVLLAHELFHVVEDLNKKTIFTRTYKVELWAPWPFHNRSTVRCLGEMAGMAFAKELTGLGYSPFVLDVFLVYGYSPAVGFDLYKELMDLKKGI